MKKNKMMRLASVLLVLTLLSTSVISGTFAKYVTQASGNDSARVAHWGVQVAVDGDMFAEDYAPATDNAFNYTGTYSVSSNTENQNVVAPGTSGKITFSISGTPEVAVNVAVTLNKDSNTLKMIKLPGGVVDGVTADYYPIQWTLKRSDTADGDKTAITNLENVKLDVIENYFSAASTGLNKNYEPNTELAKTFGYYELSWKWDYEATGMDAADTYLGNVIAGTVTNSNVATEEAFSLSIVVTQVD